MSPDFAFLFASDTASVKLLHSKIGRQVFLLASMTDFLIDELVFPVKMSNLHLDKITDPNSSKGIFLSDPPVINITFSLLKLIRTGSHSDLF